MKRVAVTGALGHIGSHFIHTLQPGMYSRVDVVGRPSSHRFAGLLRLPAGVPFRYVHADVCCDDIERVVADVDEVIHLAAVTASSDETWLDSVNAQGTTRVASACARTGARLIFVSTTSVYAPRDGQAMGAVPDEEYRPYSPYALSKWRAEQTVRHQIKHAGLRATICRFGTVYGPSYGMRFHTAVNKFVWQACIGQPLTVWRSSLDQLRPYLHIEDASGALRFISLLADDSCDLFDVASNNSSVRDVVDILQELFSDVQIEFVDSSLMNEHSFAVDSQPLCRRGFQFVGDLTSGIAETVEWLHGLCRDRLRYSLSAKPAQD